MTITTRLYTFFQGEHVGTDAFGNKYYQQKRGRKAEAGQPGARRWVIYNGVAEPSKVPADWHGWLHYTQELPPTRRAPQHYRWEKAHTPNLTGTQGAYLPRGHLSKEGVHAPTTAAYEAWKP